MGEMLVSTKRAKGTKGQLKGNPLGGTPMVPPKKDKDAPTLAEIGVSRKEAAAAQFLATLPEASGHKKRLDKVFKIPYHYYYEHQKTYLSALRLGVGTKD